MTATVTSKGHIVLRTNSREKLSVKPGDVLVASGEIGRIVLRKRRNDGRHSQRSSRNYLTPPPLSAKIRQRLYAQADPAWDKVEAEAVALGRRSLKGKRVDQL
jgi:bifunctional DNA-binding transcriptional regulator/antitoxin component of YhaV-PrlF toxin-antitoxin module